MYSMTGFGQGGCLQDGREATVELKSVNHRFLDLNFRMPRSLGFAEAPMRALLQEKVVRGHVDVYVNYRNARQDARVVELDEGLLSAYIKALNAMRTVAKLQDELNCEQLSRLPDVLVVRDGQEDEKAVEQVLMQALRAAILRLVQAQAQEGERLKGDLQARLCEMEVLLEGIQLCASTVAQELFVRLKERVQELLGEAQSDEGRLWQEIALMSERAAIDEEIVRLRSHIKAARDAMQETGPCGRKLDFIVQEMNREVNTIGSKTGQIEVTSAVIALKGEIEKIREQVQNIA